MNPHQQFLKELPDQPLKAVLTKTGILLVVGSILSLVNITVTILITKNTFTSGNLGSLIQVASQDIPFLFLTLILFYRKKLSDVLKIIKPATVNWNILVIIGALLVYFAIVFVTTLLATLLNKTPEIITWLQNYANQGEERITIEYLKTISLSLLVFLAIGIFEEFIFRATIFRFLRRKGLIIALIISSVIFMLIHGAGFNISLLIGGLIFALYYEYTNNFWGTVLIHTLMNQFGVFYTYYFVYLIVK